MYTVELTDNDLLIIEDMVTEVSKRRDVPLSFKKQCAKCLERIQTQRVLYKVSKKMAAIDTVNDMVYNALIDIK